MYWQSCTDSRTIVWVDSSQGPLLLLLLLLLLQAHCWM
jgi:hypothetical protein